MSLHCSNIHLPRGRGKRSLSEILTRTTRTSRRRSYQKLAGVGSPLCQWEMSFPSLCLCRAQGPPAPGDLKPDEQLESYSVKSAALDGTEKSTSSAEPGPAQAVTPKPDKTEPVHVPPEVPASALFTIDEPKQTQLLVLTTPNRSESCPLTFIDKPELAFQQSDFDLEPVSTTVENSSVSPVIVEHLASAETPADEIEAQEAEPPKNEPEPGSEDESNDEVLSPVEEPNNTTMHRSQLQRLKYLKYSSRNWKQLFQFLVFMMIDCERLQDELEEANNKARRKTRGNVKFIWELFKLRMLTESIIHNCVVKLLKQNDEESLECLSILLTTAG
ncbi:hypothetical protein HF521_016873 [Silurus meridionalis]|uniref:MIF4G domain-containing protein n=1 Tax=Silurus meridionalis TaxID=175797 RepID=A0A8T0BQY9_SILME|nr:hypothetical protein HF521_016873 [Silurus meridionalis]